MLTTQSSLIDNIVLYIYIYIYTYIHTISNCEEDIYLHI